jgi:uncharacterized protein
MPWDFILILAALAIIVPWRGTVRIHQLLCRPTVASEERLALYASTIVFQWLAAAIAFWRCAAHHYSAAELGLSLDRPAVTVAIGLGMAALLISNQILSVRRLVALPSKKRGTVAEIARRLMPHSQEEVFAFIALVATVAVCEEFLYRGFAQAAFQKTAQGAAAAGIIASALLFAAAHLYQGGRGLVVTFLLGLFFAATRSWTGSILPSVIAHFATDLSAGLAARRWLASEESTGDEGSREAGVAPQK